MSEFQEYYKSLCETFGVYKGGWDMIHLHFSPSMFCEENRPTLIAEWLIWNAFVKTAKEHNVPYYIGIDTFLKEYEKAVMSRVRLN